MVAVQTQKFAFFIAKYISVNETEKHILSESFTRENDVEAGPGVVAI